MVRHSLRVKAGVRHLPSPSKGPSELPWQSHVHGKAELGPPDSRASRDADVKVPDLLRDLASCRVLFTDQPHKHHVSLASCPNSFVAVILPCVPFGSRVVTRLTVVLCALLSVLSFVTASWLKVKESIIS